MIDRAEIAGEMPHDGQLRPADGIARSVAADDLARLSSLRMSEDARCRRSCRGQAGRVLATGPAFRSTRQMSRYGLVGSGLSKLGGSTCSLGLRSQLVLGSALRALGIIGVLDVLVVAELERLREVVDLADFSIGSPSPARRSVLTLLMLISAEGVDRRHGRLDVRRAARSCRSSPGSTESRPASRRSTTMSPVSPWNDFSEHPQPAAHDADDDEHHRRAERDGDERHPGDAALAEVFEDEVEFVHGRSRVRASLP